MEILEEEDRHGNSEASESVNASANLISVFERPRGGGGKYVRMLHRWCSLEWNDVSWQSVAWLVSNFFKSFFFGPSLLEKLDVGNRVRAGEEGATKC